MHSLLALKVETLGELGVKQILGGWLGDAGENKRYLTCAPSRKHHKEPLRMVGVACPSWSYSYTLQATGEEKVMWWWITWYLLKPSYNFWSNPFRPLQAVVTSGLIWLPFCALSHHWDCRVKWSPIDTLQAILMFKQPATTSCNLTMYFYCKHIYTTQLKTVVCQGLQCVCWVRNQRWSYLQCPWVALSWFCKITWKGQQWLVCTLGCWRTYWKFNGSEWDNLTIWLIP